MMDETDYYVAQRRKLLQDLRGFAGLMRPELVARYGAEEAGRILQDTLAEYEELIPRFPYIGGKENRLTTNLVQDGPLGIVRHPYYVSYVLIPVGLSLTLVSPWPLVSALCVVLGMGPTARVEEAELTELFGQEYKQYQQRVGRFFPRPFW